jgi:hypothetical protein
MAASRQRGGRHCWALSAHCRHCRLAFWLSGVYIYFIYFCTSAKLLHLSPMKKDVFVCMYWGLVLEKKKAMW